MRVNDKGPKPAYFTELAQQQVQEGSLSSSQAKHAEELGQADAQNDVSFAGAKSLYLPQDVYQKFVGTVKTAVGQLSQQERGIYQAAYNKTLHSLKSAQNLMQLATSAATVALVDGGVLAHGTNGVELSAAVRSLQHDLSTSARLALDADTFKERNTVHCLAVAQQGALLASCSVGVVDEVRRDAVFDVFREATMRAGREYAQAFDTAGCKRIDHEEDFSQASASAPATAYLHLADVLSAASVGELVISDDDIFAQKADSLLANATREDVRNDVARILQLDESPLSVDKASAKGTKPSLSLARGLALDNKDLLDLDLALRLCDATAMAGAAHKAAWHGDDAFIDPSRSPEFQPYDVRLFMAFQTSVERSLALGADAQQSRVQALDDVVMGVLPYLDALKAARLQELQ